MSLEFYLNTAPNLLRYLAGGVMSQVLLLFLVFGSQLLKAETLLLAESYGLPTGAVGYYYDYQNPNGKIKDFDDGFFSSSKETYKGKRIFLQPKEVAVIKNKYKKKRIFDELPKCRQKE